MAAETKRVVLAGARQVAAASGALSPVLQDWARRWSLGGGDSLRLREVAAGWPLAGEAAGVRAHVRAGAGDVVLMAAEADWRQALFGPAQALLPGDATAERLARSAADSLLTDTCAALGVAGVPQVVPGLPAAVGGQVYLLAELHQARLWLCLDAALLERLVTPPAPSGNRTLVAREQLLGAAEVELQVEIPLHRAEVGDFVGLRVGDVIRSEQGLGAAFVVRIGARELPLRAALGARQGRKAIRLDK